MSIKWAQWNIHWYMYPVFKRISIQNRFLNSISCWLVRPLICKKKNDYPGLLHFNFSLSIHLNYEFMHIQPMVSTNNNIGWLDFESHSHTSGSFGVSIVRRANKPGILRIIHIMVSELIIIRNWEKEKSEKKPQPEMRQLKCNAMLQCIYNQQCSTQQWERKRKMQFVISSVSLYILC